MSTAYNGFCVEYCGASHANMRFRTFVVTPDEFAGWISHQETPAAFAMPAPAPAPAAAAVSSAGGAGAPVPVAGAAATTATTQAPPTQPIAQAGFIAFARERMPEYTVPKTPTPSDISYTDPYGDAGRGAELLMRGQGACLGCHTIRGNPSMIGQIGPNLTHVGSRTTIAAGLYPNDARHLALWIKNARKMKPGVLMPTIGLNEYDPQLGTTMKAGLTDQQIADIVAYLQALK
jgi:cytochrome c oxidase subunit 2